MSPQSAETLSPVIEGGGGGHPALPREINLAAYFLDGADPGRTALVTPGGRVSYGRVRELSCR
ncbi:hypothetical protein, partial [Microbispora sp. GKU 823]|uniref:hypothetical protein n=1 Tax=Microbispora sp. GKU 823 TaxID=1652100 RepID=UPI0011806914